MQDCYSIIHHLYQIFYAKKYGNEKYVFVPTEKALVQINGFLNIIDKKHKLESVGVNFFLRYFIFQFSYWENCNIVTFSERITLPLIIGNKAFQRYEERDKSFDWILYQSDFIKNYKINTQKIISFFADECNESTLNLFEESEKKRFFNTPRGFLNCVEKTTLYYHRSKHCLLCKNKDDCKKLLLQNYSSIYESRGYSK